MEKLSKIRVRSIVASASVLIIVFAYHAMAKSNAPALTEVLRKQNPSMDWGSLFFGFFALSLSTLTFAKAFEVFKKSNSKKDEPKIEFDNTEIDSLKSQVEELTSFVHRKNVETETLRAQIGQMEETIRERMNSEELLKKSSISLRKECEKLLSEKEQLTLELNRKNWEVLFAKEEKPVKIEVKENVDQLEIKAPQEVVVEEEISVEKKSPKAKIQPFKHTAKVLKKKVVAKKKPQLKRASSGKRGK